MAEAVFCPACGAKLKSGYKRCLRCGELLEASSSTPRRMMLARLGLRQGPVLIASIVVSFVLLIGVAKRVISSPQDPAAASAITTPFSPQRRAPAQPEPSPSGEVRFLDPKHGGTVAYSRGDYGSAAERYRKVIEANPHDADALNNLGQVLARTGNAGEAVPYFEQAITLYPKVWAYRFNLAHAHGQTSDWARAVTEYQSAGELFPDDYATQFNLAMALHKQGREAEAVPAYLKAITLAPGEASFHLSLGISYEKLNRPNDAVESYRRYLELAPEAPDAQRVKEHLRTLTGTVAAEQGSNTRDGSH